MKLVRREPVAIGALAQLLVVVLTTFGLEISREEAGTIIAAVVIIVSLLQRQSVTPA